MYAQMEKPKERKIRALANTVSSKKRSIKQGVGLVDNRPESAGQKLLQKQSTRGARFIRLRSPVIQLHKGTNEFDETLDDMIIYKVVLKSNNNVVYVGQTEQALGMDARFKSHLSVHTTWSNKTHKIMKLEAGNWTRFETDCSEQYWIDKNGGKESLENEKNQVSKSRFEGICKYQEDKGLTLYRGEIIGFPKGWKPLN
ncbi:MAG: hypothetical protein GY859_02010 [Desulfobacterales bacterium]|nr:hypothetical protein [Desulfobacterales bacterium]